jgi:hypothetical protein
LDSWNRDFADKVPFSCNLAAPPVPAVAEPSHETFGGKNSFYLLSEVCSWGVQWFLIF